MSLADVLTRVEKRLKVMQLSADAASTKAGKPDAIRNLKRAIKEGRRGVSSTTIAALAEVLQTSSAWLLEGTGPEVTKPVRVVVPVGQEFGPDRDPDRPMTEDAKPFPDALPQMVGRMGGGSTGAVISIDVGEMQSREEVGEWWRVPPSVLRGLARADVARTVAFAMDGDSMEPTIQRTDIVFIDTGRRTIEPDGIWAVDYGLGRTMKRVLVERIDGEVKYILKSDNARYPDSRPLSPDEVTVFGRYLGRFSVY
jgi:hypothetical protein